MKSMLMAGGVGFLGAVLTVACADSSRSLNPTAPSAVVSGPQSLSDDQGVSGTMGGPKDGKGKPDNPGNGNGNKPDAPPGNGKPEVPGKPETPGAPDSPGNSSGTPQLPTPTVPEPPPGVSDTPSIPSPPVESGSPAPGNTTPRIPPGLSKAEIQGLIGAIAGSTVTVNGQVITVPSSAAIRQGSRIFAFADLVVGDKVHIRATKITDAGSVSLEATEVKLQERAGESDDPGDSDDEDADDDDEDPVPTLLVSVGALDGAAAEAGLEPGTFRFSRSGDTAAELTVTIAITGTATNGIDYENLPLTVTFAAGAATADVSVVPLADATSEVSETVIVTVVDGADYDQGSPATATVTITG